MVHYELNSVENSIEDCRRAIRRAASIAERAAARPQSRSGAREALVDALEESATSYETLHEDILVLRASINQGITDTTSSETKRLTDFRDSAENKTRDREDGESSPEDKAPANSDDLDWGSVDADFLQEQLAVCDRSCGTEQALENAASVLGIEQLPETVSDESSTNVVGEQSLLAAAEENYETLDESDPVDVDEQTLGEQKRETTASMNQEVADDLSVRGASWSRNRDGEQHLGESAETFVAVNDALLDAQARLQSRVGYLLPLMRELEDEIAG